MRFEYVELCVFVGRRLCAPVVTAINIGKSCVPSSFARKAYRTARSNAYYSTVGLW